MELIIAILCVLASGYCVLLQRSYEFMGLSELKRQARHGNDLAKRVYRVRSIYGGRIYVLIWLVIGLSTSLMIIMFETRLWSWVTILVTAPIVIVTHAILPLSRYPRPSLRLAAQSSEVVQYMLIGLSPIMKIIDRIFFEVIDPTQKRYIHSREELLEILADINIKGSSVSRDEVRIASLALSFGDKKVTEIMTPRSVVRAIKSDQELSPVVLGELHQTGFSRLPVSDPVSGLIVGILYMKDIVELRTNQPVSKVMRPDLYYVNEFSSIDNVLNAFLRSKHHLFLVVNEFEDYTGIITIEDVLEQILGKQIVDEFDQYADMRAVARQLAVDVAKGRPDPTE